MSDQPNNDQAAEERLDIIPIEDLDQFARIIAAWHGQKVALLHHMKSIPPGTPVSINDGADIILEGDLLAGFILGLEIALIEFASLPFAAEPERHEQH